MSDDDFDDYVTNETFTLWDNMDEVKDTSCYHDFVKYVGFTEVYEYCSKCGEKR